MKRIFILSYWLGILTTLNCNKYYAEKSDKNEFKNPGWPSIDAGAEYSSGVTTAAVETQSSDSMRTLLSYSADPANMGQTVDFTCTTYNGSAFANSSNAILSAWLYTLVSGSQTQVAFGSAISSPYGRTIPCNTLASLSGRTVQCTFTATAIVFSLSNVLVSDEKKYGCQVFVSTNAAYAVSWTNSLRVYALPQQPLLYFYPSNPLSVNQNYLHSVTCAGNVGNPTHKISLYYQPAANPGKIYLVTVSPSIRRKTNADGTINATYTYNLPQSVCQYDRLNNTYGTDYSYSCQEIGGYLNSNNNGDLYSCVISNNDSTISSYDRSTTEALELQYQAQSPVIEVNASTLYPVYGYSSTYNVSVNDCLTISCSSSGNPAPTVLWIRLSSQANQTLAISKFTRNKYTAFAVATGSFQHADILTFVCFVSNQIGTGSNGYTSVLYQTIYINVKPETSGHHSSKSRCGQTEGVVDPEDSNGTINDCIPLIATTVRTENATFNYTRAPGDQTTQNFNTTSVESPRMSATKGAKRNSSNQRKASFKTERDLDDVENRSDSIVTASATTKLRTTSESTSSSAATKVTLSDKEAIPGCDVFHPSLKPSWTLETLLRHINIAALICVFISSSFLSGMIVFIIMKIKANKQLKLTNREPAEKAAEIKTAKVANESRKETTMAGYENRLVFLDETEPIVK